VEVEASSTGHGVLLTVSDDGAGVPADLIPTVFEPFTRGPNSRAAGGSGIGLALCRSLVAGFGGRIWYEPNHPHGARFKLRLRRPA